MTRLETASKSVLRDGASLRARSILRAAIYSVSRLAVNLAPNLLTLVVLRWLPVNSAHTILTSFAVAIFFTNTLATWLELSIFRYGTADVARSMRRVIWLESAITVLLLACTPSLAGSTGEFMLPVRVLLAVVIICDLVYRTGIAALQISGRDRLWIGINSWRLAADVLLTAGVAYTTHSSTWVLTAMAATRLCAAVTIARVSPLYQATPGGQTTRRWTRYGISIAIWTFVLQLLQYLPQFSAVHLLSPLESTAFLGGFRVFVQTGLLVTGLLLLYLHPKLLSTFHEHGPERFFQEWVRLLPWYGGAVCAFAGVCAALWPLAAGLVLGQTYGRPASVLLWATPGIIGLSLANYVQKLLEVREESIPMTVYLAVSTLSFAGLILLAPTPASRTPAQLCIALSLAFTVYLALISAHALRSEPRFPSSVGRLLRPIGGIALMGSAGLLFVFFKG